MADNFPKPAPSPSLPATFNGEIYQAVGKYARSAVLYAFEQMDGPEGLADWASKNQDEFYTKLFPKIIARESEVTHHKSVDQLMDVIDADYDVDGVIDDVEFEPPSLSPATDIPELAPNWNNRDISENVAWPDDATQSDDTPAGFDLVEVEE
jgi:hypothetical protein